MTRYDFAAIVRTLLTGAGLITIAAVGYVARISRTGRWRA